MSGTQPISTMKWPTNTKEIQIFSALYYKRSNKLYKDDDERTAFRPSLRLPPNPSLIGHRTKAETAELGPGRTSRERRSRQAGAQSEASQEFDDQFPPQKNTWISWTHFYRFPEKERVLR